jgi:hypothetical protein
MKVTWKQKSPPVGGRAVDDRKVSRSVAPSRRKARPAPPEVSGRGCSDGDQVRHAERVVMQSPGTGQPASWRAANAPYAYVNSLILLAERTLD